MSNNFNDIAREIFEVTLKYGGCTVTIDTYEHRISLDNFRNKSNDKVVIPINIPNNTTDVLYEDNYINDGTDEMQQDSCINDECEEIDINDIQDDVDLSDKTINKLNNAISQLLDDASGTFNIHSEDDTDWLITEYKHSGESPMNGYINTFTFKRAIDNQLGYKDIFTLKIYEYEDKSILPSYTLKIEGISGIPEVDDYAGLLANDDNLEYVVYNWITINHPYAGSIIKLFKSIFAEYFRIKILYQK